jgi:N-glycosidase YbiA
MRVILKPGMLILAPETDGDRDVFSVWCERMKGHVFHFAGGSGAFRDLGPLEEACHESINIVFDQVEERWRPISNLAHTPFVLRGMTYASVEGFWQGLKFEGGADRARVAALWGKPAKQAARGAPELERFAYDGRSYVVGGPEHRSLMLQACRAKFDQHGGAREALLATGNRPLTHQVRRDSKTIPGVVMADIWTRIRAGLRNGSVVANEPAESAMAAAKDDGRILYFDRDRAEFGFLSHFHPSPITLDSETWPTVEHYFQAQKSLNPDYRAAIRAAETPAAAKQLAADPDRRRAAAQKSWFLKSGEHPRRDWAEVMLDIMRRADQAKFTQNPELGERLLATGTAELIEDSPFEPFWGVGHDGAGENWAGRVLMEVRAFLQAKRGA